LVFIVFPEENKKKSRLEQLEDSLYAGNRPSVESEETVLHLEPHQPGVSGWKFTPKPDKNLEKPNNQRITLLKKILIGSVIFFLAAVTFALYTFFGSRNVISSDNINIEVSGPVAIAGGESFPLQVTFENQNNAPLDSADLLIEYPGGTKSPNDLTKDLRRYRESLGVVPVGGKVTKQVEAIIFGAIGDRKMIAVSIEYRVSGSNAIFSKKKDFPVTLKSSPVTVTVDSLRETSSNQNVTFDIQVVSNSSAALKDLTLVAEYPYGLEYQSASPDPAFGSEVWKFGDLKPGARREVKITGKVIGQEGEERAMRFYVGTGAASDPRKIAVIFIDATQSVTITKPFLAVGMLFNGSDAEPYVARGGQPVRVDLTWANNLADRITNVVIEAKLNGSLYNRQSVTTDSGFWRSIDNTVVWDHTNTPSLDALNPGQSGIASFSMFLDNVSADDRNLSMNIDVDIKALRTSETNVPEEINSTISKTIKFASSLGLTGRLLYSAGPFTNTGPIPPQAEKATTYTVAWAITNGSNDLSGVQVSANLPSYVQWLGVTSPTNELLSYNPIGGQVVWNVGAVKAGTGFSTEPREVYFQVSLLPGLGQVGRPPVVIGNAAASGHDDFADIDLSAGGDSLITKISTDPNYHIGDEYVTK
jgi:hypothetical protein